MIKVSIGKTGKTIEVDFDAMPDNAKAYIIAYGLKQKLNDVGASITEDVEPDADARGEQKFAVAEKALAALMSGDISTRQAASAASLEDREFSKWLRAKFKELFKEKVSELVDDSDDYLAKRISAKLGIGQDVLEAKVRVIAAKAAETAREIARIKAASKTELDIEF